MLYNHSILPYDDNSIYFIDKLHITFKLVTPLEDTICNVYNNRESYVIGNSVRLKSNYSNGNNYHYSFKMEFDGVHFGYLHLKNTKKTNICKIEIDNRILYDKPILYTLARLFYITSIFNLKFMNINLVEIARDTKGNQYLDLSLIYYQSTKCNRAVHTLTKNVPRYKPVTKVKIQDYPNNNGTDGTFTIGTKNSEATVKVYSKSHEISENGFRKDYIEHIHKNHFGSNEGISRVEVALNSNAFRVDGILFQYNSNLIAVLNPNNYPKIFFRALGDKLTFKNLSTRKWDEANNDKYDRVNIIPQPDFEMFKQRKVLLPKDEQRFSHSNHINKYKFKLMEYLDDEISYTELKRYFRNKWENDDLSADEIKMALNVVRRNYNNAIPVRKNQRLHLLLNLFERNLWVDRLYRTLCQIIKPIIKKRKG